MGNRSWSSEITQKDKPPQHTREPMAVVTRNKQLAHIQGILHRKHTAHSSKSPPNQTADNELIWEGAAFLRPRAPGTYRGGAVHLHRFTGGGGSKSVCTQGFPRLLHHLGVPVKRPRNTWVTHNSNPSGSGGGSRIILTRAGGRGKEFVHGPQTMCRRLALRALWRLLWEECSCLCLRWGSENHWSQSIQSGREAWVTSLIYNTPTGVPAQLTQTAAYPHSCGTR